jgi:hypothetical protein
VVLLASGFLAACCVVFGFPLFEDFGALNAIALRPEFGVALLDGAAPVVPWREGVFSAAMAWASARTSSGRSTAALDGRFFFSGAAWADTGRSVPRDLDFDKDVLDELTPPVGKNVFPDVPTVETMLPSASTRRGLAERARLALPLDFELFASPIDLTERK